MSKRDYTKFSKTDMPADAGKFKANPVDMTLNEFVETLDDPIIGVVTDCLKLNLRAEPSLDAEVICEINASTELVITPEESTNYFFKVCTSAGIEGFCMKKFITIL